MNNTTHSDRHRWDRASLHYKDNIMHIRRVGFPIFQQQNRPLIITHETLFHQHLYVWLDVAYWSLRVVDGHGLHGVGQVLVPPSLLLLLPSILLFL